MLKYLRGENMKQKSFICLFLCILMICACGCSPDTSETTSANFEITGSDSLTETSSSASSDGQLVIDETKNNLSVHFIDVGQGDAIFIELPNNESMLIDAGERKYSQKVIKYIENLGYKTISYVVGTHPHSDHIGGLEDIINSFEISNIFMSKVSTTTKTFEDLLLCIKNKGLKITTAKKDLKIIDKNNLQATVLSPIEENYSNLNNYSVVILLKYKSKKFLFTGDAEAEVEMTLEGDISCDILKVGHHGSNSSTSNDFLMKVSPKFAVISCGKGNIYGHPHKETIEKFKKAGTEYMTTEDCGNIVVVTDGNDLAIRKEFANVSELENSNNTGEENNINDKIFVLNISTKKIHYPDCRSVKTINDENKKETTEFVEDLVEQGYAKCGICKPE